MAKDTLSIMEELWKGFGNNPDNTRTFDTMANMLPPMAVYRGGKTLGGVPDKVAEGDYSGAAIDTLTGALDVAPAGVLVRPAGRAIKAGAKGAAPIVDDLLSGYMDATGMVLNAAPKGTKVVGGALRSEKLANAKNAKAGPITLDQLRDSSSAVAERRKLVKEALSRPVEQWVPNDKASYFDRSLIRDAMGGHPGVQQASLERLQPTNRTNLAPAENLFSKDNVELIKAQIDRGLKMGGETYYPSTYPIRARYEELNGPITFQDFVRANAATSPQAPLPINIPNATVLMYMKKRGIPTTWENVQKFANDMKQQHGVGFFLGPSHVDNWNMANQGKMTGFDSQQKIASYGTNLEGNFKPYTLDTHETKGLSQGTAYFPYFDKQKGVSEREYGTIERNAQKIAESLGLDPANAQAARWFGGGELTGLRSPRGDYLNTLEDLVRYNAQQRGWDTSRGAMQGKIDQILSGDEILLPYWKRTPTIEYNTSLFD